MTAYWLVAVAAFPIIATVIVGDAKQVAPIDTADVLAIALFSLIFSALWPVAVVIAIAMGAIRLIAAWAADGSEGVSDEDR